MFGEHVFFFFHPLLSSRLGLNRALITPMLDENQDQIKEL